MSKPWLKSLLLKSHSVKVNGTSNFTLFLSPLAPVLPRISFKALGLLVTRPFHLNPLKPIRNRYGINKINVDLIRTFQILFQKLLTLTIPRITGATCTTCTCMETSVVFIQDKKKLSSYTTIFTILESTCFLKSFNDSFSEKVLMCLGTKSKSKQSTKANMTNGTV